MAQPKYAMSRDLPGVSFDDAMARTKAALAAEGFGILTEADVQATFKKKLDVDRPRYTILGACKPSLAHQALELEPHLGLLLPCNVVVMEEPGVGTTVSFIDPKAMFSVVERADMDPIAKQVETELRAAMNAL